MNEGMNQSSILLRIIDRSIDIIPPSNNRQNDFLHIIFPSSPYILKEECRTTSGQKFHRCSQQQHVCRDRNLLPNSCHLLSTGYSSTPIEPSLTPSAVRNQEDQNFGNGHTTLRTRHRSTPVGTIPKAHQYPARPCDRSLTKSSQHCCCFWVTSPLAQTPSSRTNRFVKFRKQLPHLPGLLPPFQPRHPVPLHESLWMVLLPWNWSTRLPSWKRRRKACCWTLQRRS